MAACLNKNNGCTNQAYERDGSRWTQCLECLRKSYVPKTLPENYWYKAAKFWRQKAKSNEAHHKKMMRRFSMRIQRLKSERNNTNDDNC